MSMILSYLGKEMLKKLLTSKKFWIFITIIMLILYFICTSLMFFMFRLFSEKVDEKHVFAAEHKDKIIELYTTDLNSDGNEEGMISTLLPEKDITSNTGTVIDNSGSDDYSGTISEAEKIEGSSLTHQVHNAIVAQVNKAHAEGNTWITYSMFIGKGIKESTPLDSSIWVPFIGVNREVQDTPGINLGTLGVNSITNYGSLGSGMYQDWYIGPFQVSPKMYFDGVGSSASGWTLDKYKQLVASSNAKVDGNGDGKSDPFNYLDGLVATYKVMIEKYNDYAPNRYKLSTNQNESDMHEMLVASAYVGVGHYSKLYGFDSTMRGTGSGYPFDEPQNPHIQLLRKAVEEYHNGGDFYLRARDYVREKKTTNGTGMLAIIDDFYEAHKWDVTKASNVAKYRATYTDPTTGVRAEIKNQEVHYAIAVFWGGKAFQEGITEALGGN